MYRRFKDSGFEVLGFPCNQFLWQEPASDTQIAEFCSSKYGVKFPMFSKIEVNGASAAPLYKYLTSVDTKPAKKGKSLNTVPAPAEKLPPCSQTITGFRALALTAGV